MNFAGVSECFILAGGQSRRFGEDKLLFKIGNVRTVERVIRTAREVCPRVRLVAKDRDKFRDLEVEVVEDLLPDQAPIVGIYTALRTSSESVIVVLSGDLPLLKADVLRLLISKYREPVTVVSSGGKLHPLLGLYSRSLLPSLEEYIDEGRRSLVGFLEMAGCSVVDEEELREVDPDLSSLLNMNTKEDLKRVLERMG